MSVFVLTHWKTGPDGREPDLPDAVAGYSVLLSDDLRIVASVSIEQPEQLQDMRLNDNAATLLESAEMYIPAMARARHRINNVDTSESDEAFLKLACDVLQNELDRQPVDRATLVKSRKSEIGYRAAGEYVWGLSMSKDGARLTWAASDACVYTDSADTLEISEEIRQRLTRAGR